MPTPLNFIDGPMPEDRMPEDRPEPADYDGRYTEPVKDTTCWCDFCNLTGTPCRASRGL